LKRYPLHRNQHAYQTGETAETAICNVIRSNENAHEQKEIGLGTFLTTERAFDRTSFDTLQQDADMHGTEPAICKWVCSMLESKNVITTLPEETSFEACHIVSRRFLLMVCGNMGTPTADFPNLTHQCQ
jgi:hypothetical protein